MSRWLRYFKDIRNSDHNIRYYSRGVSGRFQYLRHKYNYGKNKFSYIKSTLDSASHLHSSPFYSALFISYNDTIYERATYNKHYNIFAKRYSYNDAHLE